MKNSRTYFRKNGKNSQFTEIRKHGNTKLREYESFIGLTPGEFDPSLFVLKTFRHAILNKNKYEVFKIQGRFIEPEISEIL